MDLTNDKSVEVYNSLDNLPTARIKRNIPNIVKLIKDMTI